LLLVVLTVGLWIVSLDRSREPCGMKEASAGEVLLVEAAMTSSGDPWGWCVLLLDVTCLGAVGRDDESGGPLRTLSVRCRLRGGLPDCSSNGEFTSSSKQETSLERHDGVCVSVLRLLLLLLLLGHTI
jgi:hypothetical protein